MQEDKKTADFAIRLKLAENIGRLRAVIGVALIHLQHNNPERAIELLHETDEQETAKAELEVQKLSAWKSAWLRTS